MALATQANLPAPVNCCSLTFKQSWRALGPDGLSPALGWCWHRHAEVPPHSQCPSAGGPTPCTAPDPSHPAPARPTPAASGASRQKAGRRARSHATRCIGRGVGTP